MVADQDEPPEREESLAADLQEAYGLAILARDAATAEAAVREAIAVGLSEAEIDDQVIRPALVLVGDLWEQGLITIADEQAATAISLRVLALQREAFRVARQRAEHRVLLAAAQGERHMVGLEMAASVIMHAGYDVRFRGADLHVTEIRLALAVHRPAVIGFTTASSLDLRPPARRVRGGAGREPRDGDRGRRPRRRPQRRDRAGRRRVPRRERCRRPGRRARQARIAQLTGVRQSGDGATWAGAAR